MPPMMNTYRRRANERGNAMMNDDDLRMQAAIDQWTAAAREAVEDAISAAIASGFKQYGDDMAAQLNAALAQLNNRINGLAAADIGAKVMQVTAKATNTIFETVAELILTQVKQHHERLAALDERIRLLEQRPR